MSTTFETLARRAVACKHWRWMPGMRVVIPTQQNTLMPLVRVPDENWLSAERDLPDLADPATAGCLLALVFELEGRRVWPSTAAINLAVYGPTHLQTIESLVAALEV